ncbi:hypothetical protein EYF80_041966 [Liparis tanakae]|uniref:Uncharacterized protein n=1 Tax=Liparis tanakae TaxID=230148 RepID=A0A4Z2G4K9_9TELE|nr:hypothetical protein EYF80_041966 [Liparis tanakae]
MRPEEATEMLPQGEEERKGRSFHRRRTASPAAGPSARRTTAAAWSSNIDTAARPTAGRRETSARGGQTSFPLKRTRSRQTVLCRSARLLNAVVSKEYLHHSDNSDLPKGIKEKGGPVNLSIATTGEAGECGAWESGQQPPENGSPRERREGDGGQRQTAEEDREKTTQGANRVRLLEGEKEKSENNKHEARGPNEAHRGIS